MSTEKRDPQRLDPEALSEWTPDARALYKRAFGSPTLLFPGATDGNPLHQRGEKYVTLDGQGVRLPEMSEVLALLIEAGTVTQTVRANGDFVVTIPGAGATDMFEALSRLFGSYWDTLAKSLPKERDGR